MGNRESRLRERDWEREREREPTRFPFPFPVTFPLLLFALSRFPGPAVLVRLDEGSGPPRRGGLLFGSVAGGLDAGIAFAGGVGVERGGSFSPRDSMLDVLARQRLALEQRARDRVQQVEVLRRARPSRGRTRGRSRASLRRPRAAPSAPTLRAGAGSRGRGRAPARCRRRGSARSRRTVPTASRSGARCSSPSGCRSPRRSSRGRGRTRAPRPRGRRTPSRACASSCWRVIETRSSSGSVNASPSARPRGTIVTLCSGSLPSTFIAQTA